MFRAILNDKKVRKNYNFATPGLEREHVFQFFKEPEGFVVPVGDIVKLKEGG